MAFFEPAIKRHSYIVWCFHCRRAVILISVSEHVVCLVPLPLVDDGFDRDGSLQTQIVIIVIIFDFWYMMIWCTFFGIDHNEKSISISERNPYDFRWIFDLIVGNLQIGIKDSMHFFLVVNFFLAAKTKAQKPLKNAARKYAQSKIPEIFFCCRKMVCAKSPLGPSNNNKNDLWKRIIIYDDFFFSFLAVLSFFWWSTFFLHPFERAIIACSFVLTELFFLFLVLLEIFTARLSTHSRLFLSRFH